MHPAMFIFLKTMLCKSFKTGVRAKHCRIFVNIRKLRQKEKSKNTSDQNFNSNLLKKKEIKKKWVKDYLTRIKRMTGILTSMNMPLLWKAEFLEVGW